MARRKIRRKTPKDYTYWPVIGIRGRRLKNFRVQWRVEYSRFNNKHEFVGNIFDTTEFFEWLFEKDMSEETKSLIQFFLLDGEFSCLEFNNTTDPDDWLEEFE